MHDVVIVAHEVNERGGMERALAELLKRGSDRYRFTVISRDLSPSLRGLARWERIAVPNRPFPAKYLLFAAVAGFRLRRFHAALVHTQGAIVPNRADVSSIHMCHRAMELSGVHRGYGSLAKRINARLARKLALAAERWCYRSDRLRVVAAVSPGVASEIRDLYPGIDVRITPNGIDLERFRPDSLVRVAVRAEQSARADQTVVLFVGGEWRRKGLDIAVEAVARLRDAGIDALLWVAGTGDDDWLHGVARRFGAAEHVRLLGHRDDVERLYQGADIFLSPTLYETFSLAAYEAAASGLPVVASRVSGIGELIDAGAGVEVEREPLAISQLLEELARSPERRAQIGAAGRAYTAPFSWSRSAEAVFEVYEAARGAA